ncbi:MAG: HEAT repeat domain-containing protein [Limnothrix sp.]
MGQAGAAQAIFEEQPSIHEFLNLCTEIDIAQHPQAQRWGLALLKDGDFQERWRLAKIFPKLGEAAIAPVLEIAEDPQQDVELRWFAIRILGQYKEPQAIARLIVLLDDCREEFLAEEIMRALVELQEAATDYVLPLLAQAETRLLAVRALCKIRYPNVVEPLLSVVHDDNPDIRALSIETLGSFRHYRIFTVLIGALKDPASSVRLEAVNALGFWANYAEKELILCHVQPLLHDINLEVCRQASFTLSRLQIPEAATAIATVLQQSTTPLALQVEFVQALAWIDDPSSLDYLAQTLKTAGDNLTLAILKVMGRITEAPRKKQGAYILLDFWQRQKLRDSACRQAFVYTLGQLQQRESGHLLEQLSEDTDESIRLHAIAALRKLTT